MEFYYSFYQDQLKFLNVNSGYEADGLLDLSIINSKSSDTIIRKSFKVPLVVKDTSGYNRNTKLTGQLNIVLDSGSYKFIMHASDYNVPSDSISIEENFTFNRFDENKVTSSSLQLASNITKAQDTKSIFYKNTLEVTPNPVRLFGQNLNELYYYIEFYNFRSDQLSHTYSIISKITDLNDVLLKSDRKSFIIKNESKVEYGNYNISDLKTGIYRLSVQLLNDKDSAVLERQKKFVIYNTDTSNISKLESEDLYSQSVYVHYTEEQVQKEFDESLYIMSDSFRKRFESLDNLELKKRLLYEFWKNQKINPYSHTNETKEEYFKRVKYANDYFKGEFKEGWKTDRGRVYIVYGPPDLVDRHPFEPDQRAYEIWTYDSIEGGVEFDFIDFSSTFGNYLLANSTAINELRDDNWRSRLNVHR
jgi:GWxTD domain-containing protein